MNNKIKIMISLLILQLSIFGLGFYLIHDLKLIIGIVLVIWANNIDMGKYNNVKKNKK